MPTWLLPVLGLFARPLGAIINNGLTVGAGAFITWSVKQGLPLDSAQSIAAMVVGAVSVAITGLASTQGVTIPIINSDTSNGVRVVAVSDARKAGIEKQDAPLPH